MKFHPMCEAFPRLSAPEQAALTEDIRTHGLRVPITTLNGVILDGRSRFLACEAAGVTPRFEELPAGRDPLAFVTSCNLQRRHLSLAQRALVGARLANLGEGRPPATAGIPAVSQARAAQQVGTTRDAVQQAARVLKSGTPELVDAVGAGAVSLSRGARLAGRSADEQRCAVSGCGRRGKPDRKSRRAKQTAASVPEPTRSPNLKGPPPFTTVADRLTELVNDELDFGLRHELLTAAGWTAQQRQEAVEKLQQLRARIDELIDGLRAVQP